MRGGERKGAGRKTGTFGKNNRVKMSITLPKGLLAWLKRKEMSQSRVIEKALNILRNDEYVTTSNELKCPECGCSPLRLKNLGGGEYVSKCDFCIFEQSF